MNITGFIRGYMAKNMSVEDFNEVVVKALSREFEEEVKLENISNDGVLISMKDYRVIMSKGVNVKFKNPYGIDKFILEEFEKQGFKFDKNRSQYIQYCFGNYNGAK